MSLVIAPLVVWLGSTESRGITGRVFGVSGGQITVAEGGTPPHASNMRGGGTPPIWGKVVPDLVARAAPNADMYGELPAQEAVLGVSRAR